LPELKEELLSIDKRKNARLASLVREDKDARKARKEIKNKVSV
jgi:hypothetical protein